MMLVRRVLRSFALLLLAGCTSPPSASPSSATSAPPLAIRPIPSTSPRIVANEATPREPTCEERVDALTTWMSKVTAEGEFEHDPVYRDLLAQSPLAPAWLDDGLVLRLNPSRNVLTFASEPLDIRTAPPILRSKLAAKRQVMHWPVLIHAESTTPWSRVVEIATLLESAGESEIQFVVAAVESKIPAPPHSAVTDDLERIGSGDTAFLIRKVKDAAEHPTTPPEFAHCDSAREFWYRIARDLDDHRQKNDRLARELPASIRSCSCNADIDVVRTKYWAMHYRFSGRPVAAIRLRLSSTGVPLSAPATASWQDTVAAVSLASRDGKSVHLAAR